jgi:single-strand DNA-binding protein
MARGFNQVILMGNVGSDIELRYTGSGVAVTNFRLATNEVYKKDEEWVERTTWHSIVAWGRTAEVVSEYASKGSPLHIVGSLQNKQYEDRDGNTRHTVEVKASNITLISNGGGQSGTPAAQPQAATAVEPDDELPF